MKIKPTLDRIVCHRVKADDVSKGGIIIPGVAQPKPLEAIVAAVGPGRFNDRGERMPMAVKVGDRILMQRNESGEWELGGEKFLLIEERHVLAVIEPEARAS